MQPIQVNPSNFSYAGGPGGTAVPTAVPFRTLDDLRVVHDNYDTAPGSSGKPMAGIITAIVVVGAVALGIGAYMYYSDDTANTVAIESPAVDPSVPTTSAALQTNTAAVTAPTTDTPASGPAGSMTKREESNAMPLAGQGNTHSSDSLNPAKAQAAKAAQPRAKTPKDAAERIIAPPNVPAFEPLAPITPIEPGPKAVAPPTQPEPLTPPAELPPPKPVVQ